MSASVKIMLSYDYCHFEVSKATDQDLTDKEINELRKDVQRLADEAVRQYKTAKDIANKRESSEYDKKNFKRRIEAIRIKPIGERTVDEMAMLKQFEDDIWEAQFDYKYDYEDDDETRF